MNFIPVSNKENTQPCFNRWFLPTSISAIVVQLFLSRGVGCAGMYFYSFGPVEFGDGMGLRIW